MLCNDHEVLKDKTLGMKDVLGLAQHQSVNMLNSALKTSDINKQGKIGSCFFFFSAARLSGMYQ